jgi:hypothetical protein
VGEVFICKESLARHWKDAASIWSDISSSGVQVLGDRRQDVISDDKRSDFL